MNKSLKFLLVLLVFGAAGCLGDSPEDRLAPWEDNDSDGVVDNVDLDDDEDGVIDSRDDFPLDASRSEDPNDLDEDDDGILDDEDAFPINSSESVDSDGDGLGNNTDIDDDGDGVADDLDPTFDVSECE